MLAFLSEGFPSPSNWSVCLFGLAKMLIIIIDFVIVKDYFRPDLMLSTFSLRG